MRIATGGGICSVITLHELYKEFVEQEGREIAKLRNTRITETYRIIPVTTELAISSAELRLHQNIPTADSIIAATALADDSVVISDDPHFKQISGLKVKWL